MTIDQFLGFQSQYTFNQQKSSLVIWGPIFYLLELCRHTPLFPLFLLIYARPPVLGTTLNCIIMPHNYYDNMWHMLIVRVLILFSLLLLC